ncbi:MAG: HNH endonuclease signature motif containing protein [Mobilicoccus sp.]|nr:HNH endonuclease signature motif containing protein [Mobilicoccus sp.]
MTTWIFGIDEDNPQHWDYAKRDGFWDITKRQPLVRGDLVYFWQSKASLLGLARATSDLYEISPGTPMPWNLDDDKRDRYRFRFDLDVIADEAAQQPTWNEVKAHAAVTGHTGFGPRRVTPDGETWLWAQTIGLETPPAPGEDALYDARRDLPDMSEDQRRRVQREVAIRTGQRRFRDRLFDTWGSRCIITGPQPPNVLDAAHIRPYTGDTAHTEGNGILLRADLHRLFDDHLLTLVDTGAGLEVRCSPALAGTAYAELAGRVIDVMPSDGRFRPHADALAHHHRACSWLTAEDLAG